MIKACVVILMTVIFSSLLLPLGYSATPLPSSHYEKGTSHLLATFINTPMSFEANQGQTDPVVRFLTRGPGYTLFLSPVEAVLTLQQDAAETWDVLRMKLIGAKQSPRMLGESALPGKSHYFMGNNPNKWRTNIPNYKKVRYEEVYPGIDLMYYGNQRKLEYDFVVKPGADPNLIRLVFSGAKHISMDKGDLVLYTESGKVIQKAPIIYQEIHGQRITIQGNYQFTATNEIGFYLGQYDISEPLVIDPVLEYSTFLGGSGTDPTTCIAVDANGSAYVAGRTNGGVPPFPTTVGVYDESYNGGNTDVFVSKLSPDGSALVYSTFLGGGSVDAGWGIAVDSAGSAYVIGNAAGTGFPTTPGAFDGSYHGGGGDVFVTKLSADGSVLLYSTLLGGDRYDIGNGIVVDGNGNAYITGRTDGGVLPFPTTAGAFDTGYNGGDFDGFVAKLNPNGSTLLYSTFLGGVGRDYAFGIAIDGLGNAYTTGYTWSFSSFPTTAGAFNESPNGGIEAFVTKLSPDGSVLVYSTFLGGNGPSNTLELGRAIAVDGTGSAYVTGLTPLGTPPFPTTPGAFDESYNGGLFDVFVTKLRPDGSGLIYSTFIGGSDTEEPLGIALDGNGRVHVTGTTKGGTTSFPITPGAFDESYNGGGDAFVSTLSADGSALLYSTFLGGNGPDYGLGIAVSANGSVYVTGETDAGTIPFPTTPGSFDETFAGSADGFVLKFAPDNAQPVADAGSDQVVEALGPAGRLVNLDASGSSDPNSDPMTFTWTGPFSEGGGTVTGETVQVTLPLGTHTIDLLVEDGHGGTDTDFLLVQVVDTTPPVITLGGSSPVTVEVGSLYDASVDAGATASDTVGGDLTGSIVTSGLPINTSAPGTFTVTYNVSDAAGNAATPVTRTVTVVNTPPLVTNVTLSAANINENDGVTLNGAFIDPTIGDIHTVRINWGDGAPNTVITLVSGLRSFEATYPYPDDVPTATPTDVNVIQVTVEDSAAGVGTNTTNVTVNNVSPTVGAINATIDPVEVGTLINASAFFTDPGTLDTHTAEFNWGDNTTSPGTVNPGTREVTGDHTYSTAGVYTVTLTVTDDDGGSSQSIFQFIVVYDPDAGFVTGGGGIDSPLGAYTPNPSLTGPATFGFVSKYKKGTTTPIGQTEFHFKVADLNFHSSTYEWLVVAGAKAMYKGTGTINGTGNYGFLLFALDAALTPSQTTDLFRIKIWDKDSGDSVVYDNELGAADDAEPTTAITKGSIVVHTK